MDIPGGKPYAVTSRRGAFRFDLARLAAACRSVEGHDHRRGAVVHALRAVRELFLSSPSADRIDDSAAPGAFEARSITPLELSIITGTRAIVVSRNQLQERGLSLESSRPSSM